MTERNLNSDELVSSYLDGETTPAETALVENDSALMARVKELGTARDAVSAPVPGLAEAQWDQLIDAALTAAGEVPERGVVLTLRRFSQSPLAVAAAIALIAAVLGAGLLTSRFGNDDTMDVATEALAPQALDEGGAAAEEAASGAFDSAAEMSEAAPADHEPAIPDASFAEEATDDAAPDQTTADLATSTEATPSEAMASEAAPDDAMASEAMADDAPTDEAIPSEAMAEGDLAMDGAAEAKMELEEASQAAAEPTFTESGQETSAVALGPVASLDVLVELVAEWSRTQGGFDGPQAEGGSCEGAVQDHARGLGVAIEAAFVAEIDGMGPASVDGLLVSGDDGVLSILYAVEPDCAPNLWSLVEAGDG